MKQTDQFLLLSNPIVENLTSAQIVLNRSLNEIHGLFNNKQLYIYECEDSDDEKSLEIRLNEATLSCMFNRENNCNISLLFLDDSEKLDPYINFCNMMYKYDTVMKTWNTSSHIVRIKKNEEDYVIVFKPFE